jgi:hypothetical protein
MAKKIKQEEWLEKIHQKLSEINANMLKVFWIVAVFAFLYFGLMLHLLIK